VPTDAQNDALGHTTCGKSEKSTPASLGCGAPTAVHDPFEKTSSNAVVFAPLWKAPEAAQNETEGHETPDKGGGYVLVEAVAPAGVGAVITLQVAPDSVAIMPTMLLLVLRYAPTATHDVVEAQLTEYR
jgi:predicted Fe-Mo cluster-binding NifX family protein